MSSEGSARRFTVPAGATPVRLDRFLAESLGESRTRVRRWIEEGYVEISAGSAKPGTQLVPGSVVTLSPPPSEPKSEALTPELAPLSVLYADEAMAVIDKPPGLTVHPGAGRRQGTLVHRLLARFPALADGPESDRPGIVHRLDRDTSGVMVVALTPETQHRLSRSFARREVDKVYLGIVYGDPGPEALTVDAPLGRHPRHRQRMAVRADGRRASTEVRRVASAPGVALLEIRPRTGRTHQIRVHLKTLRHPLLGDPVYGEARWKELPPAARAAARGFPRPALHAWRLGFAHPVSGERVGYSAPAPEDLRRLWSEVSGSDWPAELVQS